MKIACICNINHTQYILARYLRDMGHEVTLFLMEEYAHFYPENDSYGPVDRITVVELPWKHKELYKVGKREILEKLDGFDFYCGSEFAPAFLYKAGIKLDIYNPVGTDLIEYPFAKPRGFIPDTWAIDEYQFNLYQNGGIKNAGAIFMNKGGDENLESALNRINFRGKRYPVSLPYLYLPEYESDITISPFQNQIKELRDKFELLLISHGRCEFLDKKSVHYKGTDIMLEGLAQYIKEGNSSTCLVIMEYGNDWQAARKLAENLNIEHNTVWIPKCGRKEIVPILKHFDAAFGVLSYKHWSYSVAMEALAAGVPIIQRKLEVIEGSERKYEFFGINTPGDVAIVLEKIAANSTELDNIRKGGRIWFENSIGIVLRSLSTILSQRRKPGPGKVQNTLSLKWMWYDIVLRNISKIGWKVNPKRAVELMF